MNKFILGIKIQRSADAEVLAFSIVDVCSVSVGALSVEVVSPCSKELDHDDPATDDVERGVTPIVTVVPEAILLVRAAAAIA